MTINMTVLMIMIMIVIVIRGNNHYHAYAGRLTCFVGLLHLKLPHQPINSVLPNRVHEGCLNNNNNKTC
jgi:hypothetical protein